MLLLSDGITITRVEAGPPADGRQCASISLKTWAPAPTWRGPSTSQVFGHSRSACFATSLSSVSVSRCRPLPLPAAGQLRPRLPRRRLPEWTHGLRPPGSAMRLEPLLRPDGIPQCRFPYWWVLTHFHLLLLHLRTTVFKRFKGPNSEVALRTYKQ